MKRFKITANVKLLPDKWTECTIDAFASSEKRAIKITNGSYVKGAIQIISIKEVNC